MSKPFLIYNRICHKRACYMTHSDLLLGLGIIIYEMPRHVSTPCQLEQVCWNADVGATTPLLWELLTVYHKSNNYKDHIQGYNSAVVFVSMDTTWKWSILLLDTQPGLPFGLTAVFKQGKWARICTTVYF